MCPSPMSCSHCRTMSPLSSAISAPARCSSISSSNRLHTATSSSISSRLRFADGSLSLFDVSRAAANRSRGVAGAASGAHRHSCAPERCNPAASTPDGALNDSDLIWPAMLVHHARITDGAPCPTPRMSPPRKRFHSDTLESSDPLLQQ